MAQTFRVVDLFAGCGGITSGFHHTGRFRTVGAVEVDLAAATTYAENFGREVVYHGSIADWEPTGAALQAQVVVGGPPCQGFSNLGAKRLDDPRNQLWREYVRVLVKIKPAVFIIENVDRFLRSEEFRLLREETEPGGRLADYQLEDGVVNAADFGAAQVRRRAIVIGTRKDLGRAIEIPNGKFARDSWQTVGDRIKDLPTVHEDDQLLPTGRSVTHHGVSVAGPFEGSPFT